MRLASLLVPACAATPASTPTVSEVGDLAHTVGSTLDGAGGEIDALDAAIAIAHGVVPAGFTSDGARVTGEHLGMSYVFELTCRDVDGHGVACGDAAETAQARVSSSGSVGLPGFTA